MYKYTARGNTVAVISNGTAVLGLGNLGTAASKPVMEGKAVLFKKFADIDCFDIEVDTADPEEFINTVKHLGYSWGGINLEDIKAPECFIIEERLKELMDIPVFHDDQHGTAIITGAALINAVLLTKRKMSEIKMVVNGAGAAAMSCINLAISLGTNKDNIILCDTQGVIYKGRTEGMNKWKEEKAIDTPHRTLSEAIKGADVFLGLSVKGAMTKEMVASMTKKPIIFAMANPDPEITPEDIKSVRNDAINNNLNKYIDYLYKKLQRKGYLYRDCARLVKSDRNIFAACMMACGDADAMVTSYYDSTDDISKVIMPKKGKRIIGYSIMLSREHNIIFADNTVCELPQAEDLVEITLQTAEVAKSMGYAPRIAILSFSNFGNPLREKSSRVREAIAILDKMDLDFEYDGEMSAEVALNTNLQKLYLFCRLTGPANVLIMPMGSSATDILEMLAFAVIDCINNKN